MDSIARHTPVLRAMFGHLGWMHVMIGIACVVGVLTKMWVVAIIAISLILLVSAGLALRRASVQMDTIFDEELDRRED